MAADVQHLSSEVRERQGQVNETDSAGVDGYRRKN